MKTEERINTLPVSFAEKFILKRSIYAYEFTKKLVKECRVLDFGCGEGYGVGIMADSAKEVIAYDPDKQTIKSAGKKYKSKNNIKFVYNEGDIISPFDFITSFQVLEHIKEDLGYLNKLGKLLKKGGTILLTTPNSKLRSRDGRPRNEFHIREYTLNDLKLLIEKVPAVDYEIKGINCNIFAVYGEKMRMGLLKPNKILDVLGIKSAEDFFKKKIKFKVGKATDRSIDFLLIGRKK